MIVKGVTCWLIHGGLGTVCWRTLVALTEATIRDYLCKEPRIHRPIVEFEIRIGDGQVAFGKFAENLDRDGWPINANRTRLEPDDGLVRDVKFGVFARYYIRSDNCLPNKLLPKAEQANTSGRNCGDTLAATKIIVTAT